MLYLSERESLYHKDIGQYESFGIRAVEKGKTVAFVSDVSTDEVFVSLLAARLTEAQLSPAHLLEVIEDALP